MNIYILRKHPRDRFVGILEAFTIAKVYGNHADAANAAKEKNKRASSCFYSVQRVDLEAVRDALKQA